MIQIQEKEVFSTENKHIRRKGRTACFKRCTLLPGENEGSFEEVGTLPTTPTEEDYIFKETTDKKVRELFFRDSISQKINTFALTSREALSVSDYFPTWEVGLQIHAGDRYRHGGLLWEALQEHTSQDNWQPSTEAASLWKVVDVEHEGTAEDPIPYGGNMVLEQGKHYSQDGVVYLCTRDTGIPVYNPLSELVDIYVELSTDK